MSTVQKKNNVVAASAWVDELLKENIKILESKISQHTEELAANYMRNFVEVASEIWIAKYLLEHFEMCVAELSEADSYSYVDFHFEEVLFARCVQNDLNMSVSGIAREVANWEYNALQKIQVFHNSCIIKFKK